MRDRRDGAEPPPRDVRPRRARRTRLPGVARRQGLTPMPPPPRSAPEAFRRGLSAVVANPRLILAPAAFVAATVARGRGPGLPPGRRLRRAHLCGFPRMPTSRDPAESSARLRVSSKVSWPRLRPHRRPARFARPFAASRPISPLSSGPASPGCLLAIDGDTPEGAPLAAFRVPGSEPCSSRPREGTAGGSSRS